MADGVLERLRPMNVARRQRWHGEGDLWLISDWSNAMAGECGEACNLVKKIRRHQTHLGQSYNTPELAELQAKLRLEVADLIIYADLLAHVAGFTIPEAIVEKFNLVSEAQGFPERL